VDNPAITTPPASVAYVLADVKAWLRVNHADDDSAITAMADTATRYIQDHIGRQLVNATYTWKLDAFAKQNRPKDSDFWFNPYPIGKRGGQIIHFPVLPVSAITSIQYVDTAGNTQTLSGSDYVFDATNGRLKPSATLGSWPQTSTDVFNAVTIVFVAGYGAAAANVPLRIKQALMALVAFWYENREASGMVNYNQIPDTFTDLLSEFKQRAF